MPSRPEVAGSPSGPEPPYPLRMEGNVIAGFGRGSKELGIPTANLPVDAALTPWITDLPSGVYFGYASLRLPQDHPQRPTDVGPSGFALFSMVMSIGYNPFYKNPVRSAEVHVLHPFTIDFYDAHMRLLILGFIRPELDYDGLDALIKDINMDCDVARNSLNREAWRLPAASPAGADWLIRPL
ncbi:Riboflavin kinase [Ophiocordyceps camponoti-floridani]|uniref:Riboflavin kinase n=1 Tax=Ophiocordyceps camponoti-floridani TaxID=2030778 RepID=A0A8H4QDP3_9HYPO|nr:Riboflavin kinase [Ophiocordyceps camponoti-floridani]